MSTALCPVLVGRDCEIRTLTAALERAAHGRGGAVFLAGEAGVGKSRLAREVTTLAEARRIAVFAGRASESATRVPYRPVTEALIRAARGGFRPDLSAITEYRAALGSLVPEWRPAAANGGAEASEEDVGEGLLRALGSSPDGALLVLEDLQWADAQTVAVVEYLAGHARDTSLLCVATVRDSEPSAALEYARSAGALGSADLIAIPRLTNGAVQLMAAECQRTRSMPADIDNLLRQCEGLPFAVEEVLAAVPAGADKASVAGRSAAPAETVSLPVSVTRSVGQRLATLGVATRVVLETAAVLGSEFELSVLLAAADLTASAVDRGLSDARDAMLIESAGGGRYRFRHSLTRRAVLDSMLPPDRADRCRRAAAAVEAQHPELGGEWCELAAELHAGAGDQERAATLMLAAGQRAARLTALNAARSLLTNAASLLATVPDADLMLGLDIDEALCRVLTLTGDVPQLAATAKRLTERLEHAPAGQRRRAQVLIMTARVLHAQDLRAALEQLDDGRALGVELGDSELTSSADIQAARCAADSGDLERAVSRARAALAEAASAGLSDWAASTAVEALLIIGRQERVRDIPAARAAFERACQIAADEDSAMLRVSAMVELGTIEMLDDGSGRTLAEASKLAHASGALSVAALIDLKLGLLWTLGTDLDRARAATSRCEQDARRIGAHRVHALALAAHALASVIDGDSDGAERHAQQAEAVLPGNPEILFTTHALIRVVAALYRDDVAGALRESEIGMAYADDVPRNAPRIAWALRPLLHAVTGQDGPAALGRARAEGLAVKWNRGFFAYAEAVIAGRAGDRRQATELAARADALLTRFAPNWTHLAHWLIAPAAFRYSWGEPVRWLREAAASFTDSGQHQLAASCQATLRRVGHPAPATAGRSASVPEPMRRQGITAREMDILRLVADGLSNSQIAQRLCLSRKTVETHVASLIAKTDRTGRRELVAHAARTFAL